MWMTGIDNKMVMDKVMDLNVTLHVMTTSAIACSSDTYILYPHC